MQKLSLHRSKERGFSDFLPWAIHSDDGEVQTKRGGFLTGWYFQPPDSASTPDESATYIADRVNEALAQFGTGWSYWTDAICVPALPYPPASDSNFPDAVSRMVDEERRQAFNREGAHFENERAFVLCYHPPHQSVSKVERLFYDDDAGSPDQVGLLARIEADFKRAWERFEASVGGLLDLRRMRTFTETDQFGREHLRDELVEYLNFCATGNPRRVILPDSGAYLDTLIGGQEVFAGDLPHIGGQWTMIVTIDGFPAESWANIIEAASTFPMPYRFSQRMIALDGHDAKKVIKKYRDNWAQKVKPFIATMANLQNAPINTHALNMQVNAEGAMSLAEGGEVRFGYYSAAFVLRGTDTYELKQQAQHVASTLEACGFGARIETVNTMEAFLGSLPGEIHAQVRRPPLHTANLATLLPLSGIWTGSAKAPSPMYPPGSPALMHARTVGSIPFRANLHVGDVGHTAFFGPTGSGKSTLLNSVAMQARRYSGMRITAFDNKRGMLATVNACGGLYIELGSSDGPQLCPLALLETERDLAHAEEWIAVCYELQTKVQISPAQRAEIHHAIVRMSSPDAAAHRSLTDFCMMVQDEPVKAAMAYYTLQGSAGWLLDGRSQANLGDNPFTAFETLELLGMGDLTSLPVLLSLFRRFERSLDGKPSLLMIDEGWVVLGHPVWRPKLREWFKLLRSKNCSVVLATQSLSDAARSGMLDVLLESCATVVYGPNPEAHKRGNDSNPGPRDFYDMMGLNQNQVDIVQSAVKARDYYWTSVKGCRLVEFGIGPVQMAFAGATSEDAVKKVKWHIAEYGKTWPFSYLDAEGIKHAHLHRPA